MQDCSTNGGNRTAVNPFCSNCFHCVTKLKADHLKLETKMQEILSILGKNKSLMKFPKVWVKFPKATVVMLAALKFKTRQRTPTFHSWGTLSIRSLRHWFIGSIINRYLEGRAWKNTHSALSIRSSALDCGLPSKRSSSQSLFIPKMQRVDVHSWLLAGI